MSEDVRILERRKREKKELLGYVLIGERI